jgi:hypothetical protein
MSQMTEIILSQWVIALALGALCLGLLLFGLVPALLIAARVRGVKGAVNAMRTDLHETFERLAEKQVEASKQHQAQLGDHLSSSLREPLEKIVKSLQDYGKDQNASVAQGLQSQITTFADRLDQMLGGQVSQAKELQTQTLKSLETTIAAFQDMARTMAKTAEGATVSMVKELRSGMSRTQVETNANLSELLGKLSGQVTSSVAALEQQSTQTTKMALEQQKKITEQAQQAMETLSTEVRSQTKAIEAASQSMRTTGSDVANAVDRITEGMTGLISGAAQEIMRSGQGFADIFEKSVALNRDLNETAAALAESSKDIGVVVGDYRNARETLQGMVNLIRTTAETARGEASLGSDVVARIEIAAEKLIAAQGQADEYLVKLNGVLSGAHGTFSAQMIETVRDFQEHLSNTPPPGPMSEESQRRHSEFDRMISDWVQTGPRAKQGKAGPPRDQRVPVAATGTGRK